ncbi:acyl carrier protein [Bosea sp. (in: a-proteobacteria)]|uniref:acyl carrier protein n=1 Tax=Bosea sp. (in: a-proteobacteria) TaxID=1871050 RepID=UPI003F6EF62C
MTRAERRRNDGRSAENGTAMPTTPIEAALKSQLATLLDRDVETIAVDASFASMGLDSAAAVHFILEIEQVYGIELYPGVTADHPDIARLAEFLLSLKPV